MDELVMNGVDKGIPLLAANFPRAFLDVNREPFELDPSMFTDRLPDYANTQSVRVAGGLGTIAKIVAEGEEIYTSKLSVEEGLERIEAVYKPYHTALRQMLARTHVKFGYAVLIDCHSMPSVRNGPVGDFRPDFVIGDRYASSCSPEVTHYAFNLLRELGYQVEINKPYAGGFITEHYGRPQNGLHAIQIEINRSLYMDESRIAKSADFKAFSKDMTRFLTDFVSLPGAGLAGNQPLAAE